VATFQVHRTKYRNAKWFEQVDLHSTPSGFEPRPVLHAPVAQLVESSPCKRVVVRSNRDQGLQNSMAYTDPANQKAAWQRYYAKNAAIVKARAVENNKKTSKENKRRVREYLSTHHCVDCGEADPIVLEFDHVRGTKKHTISRMIGTCAFSWAAIEREIAKCEVRCANCHRRITHARRTRAPS
jgi:hypothetical protein